MTTAMMPSRFEPAFLEGMDRRTGAYRRLRAAYDKVVSDLGGRDRLSHVQLSLIERFVFLEHTLRKWEQQIAASRKVSDKEMAQWVQADNALQGLAAKLGMKRRNGNGRGLREYVDE